MTSRRLLSQMLTLGRWGRGNNKGKYTMWLTKRKEAIKAYVRLPAATVGLVAASNNTFVEG